MSSQVFTTKPISAMNSGVELLTDSDVIPLTDRWKGEWNRPMQVSHAVVIAMRLQFVWWACFSLVHRVQFSRR